MKNLTKKQIDFLNKYTKGSWTYNPSTGLVDVNGEFDCSGSRVKTLSGIKFGKVSSDFACPGNDLTSLEGAPQEVGGSFYCDDNKLTSLKGAPQEVGGNFWCYYNKLTSLDGAPPKVGGSFDCSRNELIDLKGAPQKVGDEFITDAFRIRGNSPEYVIEDLIDRLRLHTLGLA